MRKGSNVKKQNHKLSVIELFQNKHFYRGFGQFGVFCCDMTCIQTPIQIRINKPEVCESEAIFYQNIVFNNSTGRILTYRTCKLPGSSTVGKQTPW